MTSAGTDSDAALCPPMDALEEFAAGGAVTGDVAAHIQACPACSREIQRIHGDNEFLAGLVAIDRQAAAGPPASGTPGPPRGPGPGQEFVPGYEILVQVHAGGQGVVYAALQKGTRRRVAVKVLSYLYAASSSRVRRFEREIEVVAALSHPNIVTVFDSGITTDGRLFFAMEYIDGSTLDTTRPAEGSEIEAALTCFCKIARAVDYAHRHGVIHRDLKPGNILIDDAGDPHVVDFGLAKLTSLASDVGAPLTVAGEFMGTLAYAAPEQVSGSPDRVDIRADVYALGVILYEMLTGRLPYQVAGSMSDIVRTITEARPRRPSAIGQGMSRDLEIIILKTLDKDPRRRYQSARALADDIEHYLSGDVINARRDSTWYVLRKTLRRYRLIASLVGAAILIVLCFAVAMALQVRRITHERDRADASAAGLTHALRESDFQRGRALIAAGNIPLAEDLLWRELLRAPEQDQVESRADAPGIDDGGSPHAFWALWELYARTNCLATFSWGAAAVTFSPDGTILASGGQDGRIRLWPVGADTEREPEELQGSGVVAQIAFSPDGGTLLSRSLDGVLTLWDLAEQPPRSRWLEGEAVSDAAFAPDGRALAVGRSDGAIELWDARGRTCHDRLSGAGSGPVHLAFSPDSRLLASSHKEGIDLWSLAEDRVIASSRHGFLAKPMFSPDGRFIVFGRQENLYRWDAPFTDPPATEPLSPPWLRASAPINQLTFDPRGHLLALRPFNNFIELRDMASVHRAAVLAGHRGPVSSISFSPDSRLLATSSAASGGDGTVRLWDVARPRAEMRVTGFAEVVNAIAFSHDGASLAAVDGVGRSITIRDAPSGQEHLAIPKAHGDAVVAIAWSPDGAMLASGGFDHVVRIWDAQSGECVRTLTGHTGSVQTVQFSRPDGALLASDAKDGTLLASGAKDGTVRLWNPHSGECLAVLKGPTIRVPEVRFSPDGKSLATCGDELLIWDIDTRGIVQELDGHSAQVRAIAWCAGGTWLASGSDDLTIRIWDADAGSCLRTLEGHLQHIFSLDVSPDGRTLASADRDGQLRLWDVASGRHLLTLSAGGDGAPSIFDVAFSPDGRTLAAATTEPSIRLWDLNYHARHIAGNLEYQISRLPPERLDPARLRDLRAWAVRVRQTGDISASE